MTQEEKARAYDEAIKKAAALYKASEPMSGCNVIIETLFPELKESEGESEDEKIRKALIKLFEIENLKRYVLVDGIDIEDVLGWLERQGEHANFLSKIQVGDKVTRNEAGVLVNLSQLDRVAKKNEKQCKQKFEMKTAEESLGIDSDTYNKIVDECIFGEQKPANEEDEPQKELAASYLAKFDEKFPILPTLKGKQLADYKNFLNKCQQIFGLKYWGIRTLQAKLFEKLSLLWAAWGAEHLQGLGQTDGDMDDEILWSEEDEQRLNSCLNILQPKTFVGNTETINTKWLKSLKERVGCEANCTTIKEWSEEEIEKAAQEWDSKANFNPFYMTMEGDKPTGVKQHITTHKESFEAGVNWILKYGVQPKQEWSEEDKKIINGLIDSLTRISLNTRTDSTSPNYTFYKEIDWLQLLKGRVQPQNLTVTDEELAQAKKDAYNDALDKIEYHSGEPTFDDGWSAAIWYLKKRNIQPQSRWKPSEDDIIILEKLIKGELEPKAFQATLHGILEQLKKLKEG